ncbi:peptidoglycan/xylan/chitin deacetylase (PgdA/CDA1 family) [Luteibacter sp. Sphag1AF]|uniref:polysaccharide deacetylase family protein n=1 Tax=Luteibacter sp. Sphag1AF TaxID=2587031 RepID=UPI0016201626|nr:polysaccharide deacetylase family protein [Luteibacter sp. Sphag1AF]MBB3228582.1 peptidoglycan/xylan/chitin deacetylase (PgdA/CDA1 family) [Luteibacter sp. Sphag1AF]
MVKMTIAEGRASGIRGRLGELCYSSGLLHSLQRARSWWRKDLRILAYHRIMDYPDPDTYDFDLELISTSPERFHDQMSLLRRRFRPMRLTDVAEALDAGEALPPDAVAVTFDDGYDDNYRVAFPILRDLGIPATFFVSTGHIDTGKPFLYDWLVHMLLRTGAPSLVLPELNIDMPMPARRDEKRALAGLVLLRMKDISALEQSAMIDRLERDWRMPSLCAPAQCRPMTWDQLREMHAAGYEIGSHGVYHRMLAKLPEDEMIREIRASKATLDRELPERAALMSYPVGGDRSFNQSVIEATREAGFRAACSYICGTNADPSTNRYALYRLPVERDMGPGWFAAMLTLPKLMSYPTIHHETGSDPVAACSP